jgi:hypothetical protein
MALAFLSTEKGRKKLCLEGHLYHMDKQVQNKTYWKCEKCSRTKCPARVITEGDGLVAKKKEHNHTADAARVEAETLMTSIRKNAAETRDTATYIVSSASVGASQGAVAKLPSVDNIKRTIRKIRVKESGGPAVPQFRS